MTQQEKYSPTSSSTAAGGLLHGRIPRINHKDSSMRYQSSNDSTGIPDPLERIKRALQMILAAIPDPTPAESQLLWDMTTRQERYGWKGFLRIAEIAARCEGPAADAFPEALRGIIHARRRPIALTWCEALDRETLRQGEADLAADRFQRNPQSASSREAAIQTHGAHLSELRLLVDILHQTQKVA